MRRKTISPRQHCPNSQSAPILESLGFIPLTLKVGRTPDLVALADDERGACRCPTLRRRPCHDERPQPGQEGPVARQSRNG
jgi:hypothetical protein